MLKINLDRLITYTWYLVAIMGIIVGAYNNDYRLMFMCLSYLTLVILYHIERKKNELIIKSVKKMINSLPDSKESRRQSVIKANEYKSLKTIEKNVFELGFTSGVEFIYDKIKKHLNS